MMVLYEEDYLCTLYGLLYLTSISAPPVCE